MKTARLALTGAIVPLVLTLCTAGCARLTTKPLSGLEVKMSPRIQERYESAYTDICAYYDTYTAPFEALAVAAAQYDKSLKAYNAALSDQEELAGLKRLVIDRRDNLPSPADEVSVKAINDQIAVIDLNLASQNATVTHAQLDLDRTRESLESGFNGLALMAPVSGSTSSEGTDASEHKSIFGSEADLKLVKDVHDRKKEAGVSIAGLGQIYLDSMKRDRNDILNQLIPAAQEFHKSLARALFISRSAANVSFDATLLTTTGIASVTGSEKAGRALSALATALAGLRESVDKEVFFQQASPALLLLMQADADLKEMRLYQGMAKGIDEYSLEDGIRDYNAFLLAGQITDAIMGLSAEAVQKAREANTQLKVLQDAAQQNLTEIKKREEEKKAEKKEQMQRILDEANKFLESARSSLSTPTTTIAEPGALPVGP